MSPITDPKKFGSTSRDRPAFLVLVLVLLLLLEPALQNFIFARLVTSTLFTLMYLSSAVALHQSPRGKKLLLGLGLLFLTFVWVNSLFAHSEALDLVERFLTVAFLAVLILNSLRSIISAREVTANTLWHAICCYLLLGFVWSALYRAVVLFDPNAIRGMAADANSVDAVYFSFTCLTTLGFGDITPVATFARSLVILEAVVGPLYMAIVIAKLVALYTAGKANNPGNRDTDDRDRGD